MSWVVRILRNKLVYPLRDSFARITRTCTKVSSTIHTNYIYVYLTLSMIFCSLLRRLLDSTNSTNSKVRIFQPNWRSNVYGILRHQSDGGRWWLVSTCCQGDFCINLNGRDEQNYKSSLLIRLLGRQVCVRVNFNSQDICSLITIP